MQVAILASGSRGDVQPYVALGKGLAQSGHRVRLVTHEDFESLVRSHGLEFWPVEGKVADVAQGPAMRHHLERGNLIAIMSEMARAARQGAIAMARGGLAACAGVDLMIGGLGGAYVGLALAEKLRIPLLQAYLMPFTPTGAFPGVLVPGQPGRLPGPVNRLTHHLTRQVLWQSFRSADRIARREVLSLPPAPVTGPYGSPWARKFPVLYGFSPAVIAPPADWQETALVTGYWFLDATAEWQPPGDLQAFLDGAPPPVYVGFGSMSSRDPQATANLVLRALDLAEQRAVMLSGWGGLSKKELPDSVFAVDSIPHGWLFPRAAAVVHHGGAGTTAAGLRAGVPSIVIPFFGDQPFWGARVAHLGVGPAPIPRKKLTAERLAHALRQAITDEGMRKKARALGTRIRGEDGIARVVEVVNGIAPGRALV